MGGIVDTLFGGSKQQASSTSASGNHAYDYLSGALSPTVGTGTSAFGQIGAALGLGGDKASADAGYQNFLNSSGYQNIFNQAMKGVTGGAASKGSLTSGATLKALQSNGANLASTSFQNYLGNLQSLGNSGLQAASTIGGAGQYSTGQSDSSGYSKTGIVNSLFG